MTDVAPTQLPGVTVVAPPVPDDTVSLIVNGKMISGWTDVRVTRRCEGIPNDFEVGLTASNPTDTSAVVAYADQSCVLKIGRDKVITGTIDRDANAGDGTSHRLGIIGRGKCRNLVDCAAKYPSSQISGASALEIITKLADAYDIYTLQLPSIGSDEPIPQFNFNLGETCQELIDRIATYAGLLYYEDEQGDLVLARVGTENAASGFAYGENVKKWAVENAVDQRFSEYVCATVSMAAFTALDNAGNLYFTAYDPNVSGGRTMYLIAESYTGSEGQNELRALWEAARRAGRGSVARVTVTGWRDSGGALWTPNTLVPVTLPGLRFPAGTKLCISEVTYRYDDDGGKLSDVVVMPSAAFAPEPIVILPAPFNGEGLKQ